MQEECARASPWPWRRCMFPAAVGAGRPSFGGQRTACSARKALNANAKYARAWRPSSRLPPLRRLTIRSSGRPKGRRLPQTLDPTQFTRSDPVAHRMPSRASLPIHLPASNLMSAPSVKATDLKYRVAAASSLKPHSEAPPIACAATISHESSHVCDHTCCCSAHAFRTVLIGDKSFRSSTHRQN